MANKGNKKTIDSIKNENIESDQKKSDQIEYIASMLNSLKIIADRSGDQMLHYLIEVAEIHADEIKQKNLKNKKQ